MKIAINGFGRIGRLTLRAFLEKKPKNVEIVAINDLADINSNVHLFKYDSIHGAFENNIKISESSITINNSTIKFFSQIDPLKLPWQNLGIDLVIESTGFFTDRKSASKHIEAGAKKVLISAPGKNVDLTVVCGVNDEMLKSSHNIVSNGSCTTNCLAPIAYIVDRKLKIKSGYMTTIHAVTGDQKTIDTFHKDLRRARNSLMSMIPTSTGAAKAVGEVLPNLIGKLDGSAIRVPTTNVSLIDFCFETKISTDEATINSLIINASKKELKNILSYVKVPLVSSDFNHNPHSSIVDLDGTKVLNGNFCRILAWYDNEWGFSNRLIDVSEKMLNEKFI